MTPSTDIQAAPWPELAWEPDARTASLERLAAHVTAEGKAAIRWYVANKRPKRVLARLLRGLALLFVLLAAIIPLLAEIGPDVGGYRISPAWASMSLVLAAGCVGFDRFFGFSSAWMRFISTELRISQVLRAFELDWESRRVGWEDQTPDATATLAALQACKDCLVAVDTLVLDETERWVQEFSAAIEEIDKSARTTPPLEARRAALNLTVTNGDEASETWELVLDGGAPERHRGRTAARAGIVPGTHRVLVRGVVDGSQRSAERAFTAAPCEVIELELALA
jgi:hypothetical protein